MGGGGGHNAVSPTWPILGLIFFLLMSRSFPQNRFQLSFLLGNTVHVGYPVVALRYSNILRCSDPYEIFCGLPSNINMNLCYELMQFNTRCTHADLLNHFSVRKRRALRGSPTNICSVLTFHSLIERYSRTLLQR
jgi:hypothetical protein